MDPFMLIYTSGTTGRPKGTVHYHAGFPLKGAQDMAHLFDLRKGELMFWFTDMGWMMGPWLIIGALTLGATALLYEGAPDYPAPDRIWSIVSCAAWFAPCISEKKPAIFRGSRIRARSTICHAPRDAANENSAT
jgi:acyl-coenzyme A synthetase/AMP-(fatty) acid ligase